MESFNHSCSDKKDRQQPLLHHFLLPLNGSTFHSTLFGYLSPDIAAKLYHCYTPISSLPLTLIPPRLGEDGKDALNTVLVVGGDSPIGAWLLHQLPTLTAHQAHPHQGVCHDQVWSQTVCLVDSEGQCWLGRGRRGGGKRRDTPVI